jgi:S-adenosylmethionine synthetase
VSSPDTPESMPATGRRSKKWLKPAVTRKAMKNESRVRHDYRSKVKLKYEKMKNIKYIKYDNPNVEEIISNNFRSLIK